ncbi:hypothetical protein KZZ52_07910 [Dactylosporangium sp. AC04546]|uniref:hypothetical protein n=1 Tax=Dactylosporangium sp. AC04546 TaxID=2862460 RepID=UPI001EE08319|nr:hypothetical protein [Dactylosporangium sp. AC04546]WVK85306.1 hypothetical protein KZZ52_07910 [Dactylosporangium sp. AC04546]
MERPELVAEVDRAWTRPVVLTPVFALISLVGGALPSFSLRANLLVLGVGGAMAWLGLSAAVQRRPTPARLPRAAAWWLVPLLLFAVVEGVTFLIGTQAYPTLSRLADPVLEHYLARSAAYFGWLWAFWAMVRR